VLKLKIIISALLFTFSFQTKAAVIFSDNFQDGNVDGWTLSSSHPGLNVGIEASLLGGGPSGSDILDGTDQSLRTYLIAPPGAGNTGAFTRATTDFNISNAGDYTLDLEARSRNCSSCDIYYEIFVDGFALWDHNSVGAAPVLSFEQKSFDLSSLSLGTHTLTLGMYTTASYSGNFQAFFDDVVIHNNVPEPSILALMVFGILGLSLSRRKMKK